MVIDWPYSPSIVCDGATVIIGVSTIRYGASKRSQRHRIVEKSVQTLFTLNDDLGQERH